MGELPRLAAFIEAFCRFGGKNGSTWFLDNVLGLGRKLAGLGNRGFLPLNAIFIFMVTWRKECKLVVV